METRTRINLGRSPVVGSGWRRVAVAVAEVMPVAEIDRIWLFAPVRREGREWGTAVVSRFAGAERRRIYTATYLLLVRGRESGQGKVTVEEVGESPASVVHEVIAGVQERAGEPDPPVDTASSAWYGENDDEPTTES